MRSILCFFHIVIFSITATQNWGLDRFNSTRRIQNPPQPTFPASSLTSQTQPEFIQNIVVVQFAQEVIHKTLQTGLQEFDTKTSQLNIYSMERVYPFLDNIEPTPKIRENLLSLRRTYYVRYHSNTAPEQVADDLKITRGVIYAEPLIVHHLHTPVPKISPNDPEFRNQPELKLLGLPEAWDVVKGNEGSPKVIIAIVDTGAEWTHVDLLDNVWTNPNEIPDNGVDDVHGVNFANKNENDNDPFHLGNDHGTLVAGAAGAVTNNGIGVAGASWNAELMHINAYCRAWWGRAGICWGYEGILYAAANGADIINASWGGSIHGNTRFYDESIDLATDMGALIVAAAGNDSRNLDLFNQYPADHPRVLSVGATEKDTRKLAKFSNYGKTVDVFAPGVKIRTTDLNNDYDYVNGTSFASPLVAGVAALVKTVQRDIPPDSLREFIRASSENMDDDNPNYKGELGRGFVNAFESTKASVSFPVIRLLNWQWTDNDGNLDNATGNEVTITAELMNYYRDADQLKIRLVGAEPYSFLDWLSTDIDIGFLSQNDPKQIKFIFRVGNDTPPNKPVQFFIQVQGEEFTDYIGEIHLFLNINLSVFSLHRDLSAFYASTNGDEWSDNGGWDPENVPQSPKDFAKWHGLYLRESYLIQIELPQNNLRGFISPELGDLSNLERLDLSNNRLRGKFAPELGRLTNLGELNLSNNEFTGQILPHFGNLSNIERLDLSNNRLTGKVAPELGRLANLGELNLSENELTGEILSHLGNLRTLKVLDLSNNFLSGEIPPQLGSMNDLFVLDLSNNRFYGQIPLELGHLWNLETLNLSDNEFIGVLPRSLMRLRNLRFFRTMEHVHQVMKSSRDGFNQLKNMKEPHVHLSPQSSSFTMQCFLTQSMYPLVALNLREILNSKAPPVILPYERGHIAR